MTRRPSERQSRAVKAARGPRIATPEPATKTRSDRLVAAIDHLTDAKREADEAGEVFLAYLIAMAIQEARTAIRGRALRECQ